MPFFARAAWPGDHRDEIVAGVLVGAVVVVLGYASGIGGGSTAAGQQARALGPPATTAPAGTAPQPSGPAESQSAEPPAARQPAGGTGGTGGAGGVGDVNVPVLPSYGGSAGSGSGGTSPTGGASDTPSPSPSASPSPSSSATCGDGRVHLVQPLLSGVVDTVTGTLDGLLGSGGTTSSPSPEPGATPRICTGPEAAAASLSPAATP
jgi:hypothetical protein